MTRAWECTRRWGSGDEMTHAGPKTKTGVSDSSAGTRSGHAVEMLCAFCGGAGTDPFGILSPLASCQVCGGSGRRTLHEPVAPCAFCRGAGVHPGSRLTCTTCGGVGAVEIPDEAVACGQCGGGGRASDAQELTSFDSPLSCLLCRGKGMVAGRG